mgnify:CR=1 FL=1
MAVSANRLELLQIADAVAREKSIDREIVIAAMAERMGEECAGLLALALLAFALLDANHCAESHASI